MLIRFQIHVINANLLATHAMEMLQLIAYLALELDT